MLFQLGVPFPTSDLTWMGWGVPHPADRGDTDPLEVRIGGGTPIPGKDGITQVPHPLVSKMGVLTPTPTHCPDLEWGYPNQDWMGVTPPFRTGWVPSCWDWMGYPIHREGLGYPPIWKWYLVGVPPHVWTDTQTWVKTLLSLVLCMRAVIN